VAKKPNYDFEKRRKEQERKAKKDEKLRRKRENAARGGDDESGEAVEGAESAPDERDTLAE
jgi:hypothetical protein